VSTRSSSFDLQAAAVRSMVEHGFEPDFPPDAQQQLREIPKTVPSAGANGVRDLRHLLWSSIDNTTSRDLDQVEVAEQLGDGDIKVLVGIADVDTFVPARTAIDRHASIETVTVYTGVRNFPMLPETLSTGITSLLEGLDRLAMVIEFVVGADGSVHSEEVFLALVTNKAQLAYDDVGPWLEGKSSAPSKVAASSELQAQLRLQDACAQWLLNARHRHGALNIETVETRPVLLGGDVVDIVRQQKNRATELIEDFMIATNEIVARTLENLGRPSIRRIVKSPERWPRIAELARSFGAQLPPAPDSRALNDFLSARRAADPSHFTDLSLAVIKLMGPGEYAVEKPGNTEPDHFGLAVQDYTHATAPNRRFADLVTQRLVKAALASRPSPYAEDDLIAIARNCTLKEDSARKVEREMSKRIAAVAMSHHVGETFDAVVTGVTPHGTFVRVLLPHIEGMLVRGAQGVDVGDKLRVTLLRTDVERGYIDFGRA
jgi:VacB/RNase II family 3'-5' exoribonuclease